MKQKFTQLFVFIFLFFTSKYLYAQPGTLNMNFGAAGRVLCNFGEPQNFNNFMGMDVQSDNKIICVGYTTHDDFYDYPDTLIMCRHTTEGKPDSSFGINGYIKFSLDDFLQRPSEIWGDCVKVMPDGKIFVAFDCVTYHGALDRDSIFTGIISFNPDGTVDKTFGKNGVAITCMNGFFPISWGFFVNNITIGHNGKIMLLATAWYNDLLYIFYSKFYVLRYNSNGVIDSSFADNGIIANDYLTDEHNDVAANLHCFPDNSFIVGGYTTTRKRASDIFLLKYTSRGKLDKAFGKNGKCFQDINYSDDKIFDMQVLDEDKIIVAGSTNLTESSDNLNRIIAKFKLDGTYDSSFGTNGIVIKSQQTEGIWEQYTSVCIQPDGKILCGGNFYYPLGFEYYQKEVLDRINSDGTADNSFGLEGCTVNLFDTSNILKKVLIDNNQNIIVGSNNEIIGQTFTFLSEFLISKYNNASVLPINLISFTATKKQNTSLLQWHTCSETNCKGFTIERSKDNKTFSPIGFAASKGGGNKCNNDYSFIDNSPANCVNYYRLKILDNDGNFTYSNVENLSFIISPHIKISPNPVIDILKVEGFNPMQNYELRIMNDEGKVVAAAKANDDIYYWNISSLQSGVYYLVATNESGEKQTVKFIKQ